MKVAILGDNHLAKDIYLALTEMGAEVLRFHPKEICFHVQKSSLSQDEEIPGHGRFYDLFRIVYEQQYSQEFLRTFQLSQKATTHTSHSVEDVTTRTPGQIEDKVTSHPLTGLSERDREHLLQPLETFVDVDMVIDTLGLRRSNHRAPLLNENSPTVKGLVSVGKLPNLKQLKNLAYVICSEACLEFLPPLVSWAMEEGNQLFLVARSFAPVENHPRWLALISKEKDYFERQKVRFEERIAQWKSLEDYERAKCPRPSEPSPKLQLFRGHWPLGMDYLSDRQQAFLSLERPPFRGGEDLKTLPVDHVLFEEGLSTDRDSSFSCFEIRPKEIGYFTLGPQQGPQDNKHRVKSLLQEINRLFSKRENGSLENSNGTGIITTSLPKMGEQ